MPSSVSYKDFIKFLKHIGCQYIHTKGSHEKWKHDCTIRPIIVPKKKMIYPDVVSSNLKTLGFSYKQFQETLQEIK